MCAKVILCLVITLVNCRISAQPPGTDEKRVGELISALRQQPWPGAWNFGNPTMWDFRFTKTMKELLHMGSSVQESLLAKLSDPEITDQIVILLGGVGDERAVEPIIQAMRQALSEPKEQVRRQILLAGNLALTNITVADVIWHHGGGITYEREDPVARWSAWWQNNKTAFRVKDITQSRRYSNYPNYGIYRNLP